jgi:hypothetical protein
LLSTAAPVLISSPVASISIIIVKALAHSNRPCFAPERGYFN